MTEMEDDKQGRRGGNEDFGVGKRKKRESRTSLEKEIGE